jgi:hypothetical protein
MNLKKQHFKTNLFTLKTKFSVGVGSKNLFRPCNVGNDFVVVRRSFTCYYAGISSLSSGRGCRAWTPPSHFSFYFPHPREPGRWKTAVPSKSAYFCTFMKVSYFHHSGLLKLCGLRKLYPLTYTPAEWTFLCYK